MEQGDQDLVMTGQRNSLGTRALKNVEQTSVLLVEVEVGRRQPVQGTTQVSDDRDGFEKDLGQDDRAAHV